MQKLEKNKFYSNRWAVDFRYLQSAGNTDVAGWALERHVFQWSLAT